MFVQFRISGVGFVQIVCLIERGLSGLRLQYWQLLTNLCNSVGLDVPPGVMSHGSEVVSFKLLQANNPV